MLVSGILPLLIYSQDSFVSSAFYSFFKKDNHICTVSNCFAALASKRNLLQYGVPFYVFLSTFKLSKTQLWFKNKPLKSHSYFPHHNHVIYISNLLYFSQQFHVFLHDFCWHEGFVLSPSCKHLDEKNSKCEYSTDKKNNVAVM